MTKVYLLLLFSFILSLFIQVGVFLSGEMDSETALSDPEKVSETYINPKQYNMDILHYDLNLELNIDKKVLIGEVTITGRVNEVNIDTLILNFYDNMKIDYCFINDQPTEFLHTEDKLYIPQKSIRKDTFRIKIKYMGTPQKRGFSSFVFGKLNNIPLVYSMNEPNYASTWFPCNDRPDDKVLIDIKIKADSELVSVSNGKLINTVIEGNKKIYHWKTFYPISTYLISVNSSKYDHFYDYYVDENGDSMRIEYFPLEKHLANAKIDWKEHPKMIEVFAKIFGEYPFINEKYGVTEFLWQMGAMEHQTITSIGSSLVTGRKHFTDIYVHELAHHWWGNCVGPKTWKDIWLNEGFATYSEALYDEYLYGKDALKSNLSSIFDDEYEGTLYNPTEMFSNTVYNKGAWVLHMLRFEIGDSLFFNVLKDYLNTYKFSNASTFDFINVVKKNYKNNVDHFFKQWVFEGEGYIKVDYEWNQKRINDNYECLIKLEQVQKEYSFYKFPLEIKILFDDESEIKNKVELNKKSEQFELKFNKKIKQIVLDPDNWLLAVFNLNNSKGAVKVE